MSDQEIRDRLRAWIAARSGRIRPEELTDVTPILEGRLLSSLHVLDLLLLIEELSGRPVDVERLRPGAFRDVDTIVRHFLGEATP